jgi:uncharacterized membrane protein
MAHLEKSLDVDVPVRTAYNQWTQFEEFPRFMEGVREVRQLDEKNLRWRAGIAGHELEWTAEITQQEPDHRVGWRSTAGAFNAGNVTFESLGPSRTRVTLRLQYKPEGAIEKTGNAIGVVRTRIDRDLQRFKRFIESRQRETGAWRGEIKGGEVRRHHQGGMPT